MSEHKRHGCCTCSNAHWEDLGMHGVRRLVRGKKSCLHSTVWVLIILVSVALIVYQTLGCVVHYLTYPTTTEYRLVPPTSESTPAVTVCNLNQWRLSKLYEKGWLSSLLSIYTDTHTSYPRHGVNISSTDAFTSTGHRIEDMLLRCTHGPHECKHSNFSLVFTEHGLCYTFPRLGQYQLDLFLNAEEYEYCELANQRVGFIVIIHEAESSPFLWPTHVVTSPGMHTQLEIHSSRMSHNDVRYTSCSHVTEFTRTACQSACLYQLIVDRCGCTPYWSLKHQAAHFDDVSTCSLHSHIKCVQKQVSELTKDSLVSICHCDASCEYTMYSVSISASHLSRRDHHLYMTDKHLYTVTSRLTAAENIRAKTYSHDIDQNILAFSRSLEDFRYQVETLKRNLQQVEQNVNNLMARMYARSWFHYHVGLTGVEKIFKHRFLPQWELVDLQFLQPLVAGCHVILFGYDHVVAKLDMTSSTEVAVRRTMFLTMDEQLNVRMELAIQGLDNFTKVYYSFLGTKPTTPYVVTPERRYDAALLPLEAMAEVGGALRTQYSAIADLLAKYMEHVLAMKTILKDLYSSQSGLNRTAYDEVKDAFQRTTLDLQTHVELFRVKAIGRVQEIVESRSAQFRKLNDTLSASWSRLRGTLDDLLDRLDLISMRQYPHVAELGRDAEAYVAAPDKLLSDLSEVGASNSVQEGVADLVKGIADIKSRGETVGALWRRFEEHYLGVWSAMLGEASLRDLYSKLNADVKNVVRNPSATNNLRAVFAHNKMLGRSALQIGSLDPDEFYVLLNADFPATSIHGKEEETRDVIGQYRRLTDVGLQLQDFDRQLSQSYDNMRTDFDRYKKRATIDGEFIRDNVLSLSIKMAADGHQRIIETPAYSIYHLLRDIGILLFLFLGASIMTFLEILDILVMCVCCYWSSPGGDKDTDDVKTPTTPPSSTRHVTFQFPAENHIGSPTKPALKRPKLEYYPGELDIQTNLDDTHAEIL